MKSLLVILFATCCMSSAVASQEASETPRNTATNETSKSEPLQADETKLENSGVTDAEPGALTGTESESKVDELAAKARDLAGKAEERAEEIAARVDQDERAQKAAAGLLGRIYLLAESMSFSSFHWIAFALMASGVVSFALQLVLGKLVLLFHGSLNVKEICSDAVGFVISTVGLVLTTQAAAENSSFTHSPAAVLSAAITGVAVGLTLFRWGQHQELNAVRGKKQS